MSVPEDFLELSVKGMKNLKDAGRSNILYAIAKDFGTQRCSDDDTLFPTKHVDLLSTVQAFSLQQLLARLDRLEVHQHFDVLIFSLYILVFRCPVRKIIGFGWRQCTPCLVTSG